MKQADKLIQFAENIIDTVRESLLVLDKDLRVLRASRSFYNFFKVTPDETIGALIYDLGNKQWDIPKLRELLETILPEKTTFDDYEVEHVFTKIGKRTMLLNARQIERALGKEKIILLAIEDITERKQKEESLSEVNRMTHEYVDILFNHAHAPIIIWDSSMVIIHINHAFEKLSGYDWSELKDKPIDILFPADKIDSTLELINNTLQSDERTDLIVIDLLKKDKGIKTVIWNPANIFDKEGKEIVATIAQDITKRTQTENELITSETRLRTLVNTIPDLVWVKDVDGIYLSCNRMFCRFFGTGEAEIVGKSDYDFVDKNLADFFRDNDRKAMTADKPTTNEEWITFADDGHRAYLETIKAPMYNSENKVIGILGIGRDITDRQKAEQKIQDSEEKHRALIEQMYEGIFEVDNDDVIQFVNPMFCKMLGYEEGELLGNTAHKIFQEENESITIIEKNRNRLNGTSEQYEWLMKKKSGKQISLLINAAPVRDKSGKVIGSLSTCIDITDRKRSEESLRESEERFRVASESLTDIIYEWDIKEKLDWYGDIDSITGYPPGGYPRTIDGWALTIHPEDKVRVKETLENHLKNSVPYNVEYRTKRMDGEWRWWSARGTALRFENGEPYKMIGSITDITERKDILNKIKFKSDLLTHVGQAVIATDLQGKVIYWNNAAEDIYGWSSVEAMGQNIVVLTPAEQTKEQANEIMKELSVGNSWSGEFLVKRKNGSIFPTYVTDAPIVDSNGKLTGIIGISSDITERKRAEEEITMLAHSLKSVNECVSITDLEDKIIFVNESFLRTYGYEENELIGQNINIVRSLTNSAEKIKEILPATVQGEWKGELLNKNKDGKEFPIYLSTTTIKDKDGLPLGLIGVATNISERKQNEKDMIAAKEKAEESDKFKSEFLTQMSHEIRTPLNAIVGYSDYLNEALAENLDSDSRSCFEGIQLASNRIIRTVDLILNISELNTSGYKPHFVVVDLSSQILNKLYNEYKRAARHNGLEFTYTCEEKDIKIVADEYSMTQIFTNLIDNAIKFTKKGKVEIRLRKDESGNIYVEVKDTGIGISKEFLPRIFEPFTQEEQGYNRSFDGTGLGLVLVKNYCDINTAYIEIESEKNVGSTFRIIFYNRLIKA